MRLSKLVCRLASAELAEVLELESLLVEVPEAAAVVEVEPVVEPAPAIAADALLCKPELSACACKAAIRLCMNCSTASAAVVASVLEDVEVDDDVGEEVPDVTLLVVESVPVVEPVPLVELVLPTALSCSASMMAPIKPPPGDGGGALVLEVAAVPLDVVDSLWLRRRDGSHWYRDDPELPIELTLILNAPAHDGWCVRRDCVHVRLHSSNVSANRGRRGRGVVVKLGKLS